ncbi:MAG: sigma-70 family RNA polymerase sigma factor [Planctomycetota bacterium]
MQHELENLVQKCKKGDSQAFNDLIQLYSNRCYGYFYRLTGRADLSEELLSDLFIRLVRKIGSFKSGSFEKWLFTVASNIFRDYLRRHYRQNRLITEKAELIRNEQDNAKQEPEIFDKLHIALEKLDEETRELLTLRYFSKLSFKELAEMRSEPIGTTLSKVHRGIKKLRRVMEEL